MNSRNPGDPQKPILCLGEGPPPLDAVVLSTRATTNTPEFSRINLNPRGIPPVEQRLRLLEESYSSDLSSPEDTYHQPRKEEAARAFHDPSRSPRTLPRHTLTQPEPRTTRAKENRLQPLSPTRTPEPASPWDMWRPPSGAQEREVQINQSPGHPKGEKTPVTEWNCLICGEVGPTIQCSRCAVPTHTQERSMAMAQPSLIRINIDPSARLDFSDLTPSKGKKLFPSESYPYFSETPAPNAQVLSQNVSEFHHCP